MFDHDKNTALHFSSANNQILLTKILLKYGADFDAENSFKWTPIMQAASHGHLNIIKLLLKAGASPDKKNVFGEYNITYTIDFDYIYLLL